MIEKIIAVVEVEFEDHKVVSSSTTLGTAKGTDLKCLLEDDNEPNVAGFDYLLHSFLDGASVSAKEMCDKGYMSRIEMKNHLTKSINEYWERQWG